MNATITYLLSPAGQKASILSGGNGQAEQTIAVAQDSPEFPALVAAGKIDAAGNVSLVTHGGLWPSTDLIYDTPQTAAQVLARVVGVRSEKAAKEAEEKEAARAATTEVLAKRRTRTRQAYVSGVRYDFLEADWPHNASEEVRSTPEAVAWEAELKVAANQAEESARAAELLAIDQRRAEQAADAERKAKARAELRASRGIICEEHFSLNVEDGALAQVPAGCWESHWRGKNWLATISVSPSSPGGLARDFSAKAKGDYYYMLPELRPGDPIEFGADYYSGSGRKNSKRWYGYVVRVEADYIVVCESAGGKTACKEGAKWAKDHPAQPVQFTSEGGIAEATP